MKNRNKITSLVRVLAIAALSLIAVGACDDGDGGGGGGGQVDAPVPVDAAPDAAPRQVVMETKSILSTQILEAKFTGGKQDRATITLTAPRPKLDWNIHGHAGGSTQTIKEELGIMTATYEFVPPSQASWWLLLRNKDPSTMDVEVKIELYGNMQWGGWQ
jgi:hypothetical protein